MEKEPVPVKFIFLLRILYYAEQVLAVVNVADIADV